MSSYNTNNNQNRNNGQSGTAFDAFCGVIGGVALSAVCWWLGIRLFNGSGKGGIRELGVIAFIAAIIFSCFTVKFLIEWFAALGKSFKRYRAGKSEPGAKGRVAYAVIIVVLAGIGLFSMVKTVRDAKAKVEADRRAMESWSTSKSYNKSTGSSSVSRTSTSKSSTSKSSTSKSSTSKSSTSKSSTTSGSKTRDTSHSTYHKSTSDSSSKRNIDPNDLDVESYYEDYKEDFESVDDAWDDLMDNPDLWSDYAQ